MIPLVIVNYDAETGQWPERPATVPGQMVVWVGPLAPPAGMAAEGDVWHVGSPNPEQVLHRHLTGGAGGRSRGCVECGPPQRPVQRITLSNGQSLIEQEPDGLEGTLWRCPCCQRLWVVRRAPWAPSGDPQRVWRPLGWLGRLVHGRCVPVRGINGTPLG